MTRAGTRGRRLPPKRPLSSWRLLGLYWLPAVFYAALILRLCTTRLDLPLPAVRGIDKVEHAAAFGTLALVFLRALWATWPGRPPWVAVLGSGAIAMGLGALVEVLQRTIPGRRSDWADLAADAVGTALLLGLAYALLGRSRRSRARPLPRRNV